MARVNLAAEFRWRGPLDSLQMRNSRRGYVILTTLVAVVLAPATAAAQGPGSIDTAEARHAIGLAEAALSGGARLASAGDTNLTMLLREVAIAAPSLSGSLARRAGELLQRPTDKRDPDYFGDEAGPSPACDPQFCVHWTAKGRKAPSLKDGDGDKIPDYIEEILGATAQTFLVENTNLGWEVAPSDGKLGGDSAVDIYITALPDGLYGFAQTDPKQKGPKQHSFLVLDDDYKGFKGAATPLELMQATLAHEYNHVLQFGYDLFQDVWMFEATATWIEELVFSEVDDWTNFVPAFSELPFLALISPDKMYGTSIFNHWLSARYTPAVIEQAWAVSRTIKKKPRSIGAFDASIAAAGGPGLAEEFAAFAPASAEWTAAGSIFPDPEKLKEMRRDKLSSGKAFKTFLDPLAYQPLSVKGSDATGTIEVGATVDNGIAASIAIVARVGPESGGTLTIATIPLPKGGKGSAQFAVPAGTTRLTVLAINQDDRFGRTAKSFGRTAKTFGGGKFTVTLKPA